MGDWTTLKNWTFKQSRVELYWKALIIELKFIINYVWVELFIFSSYCLSIRKLIVAHVLGLTCVLSYLFLIEILCCKVYIFFCIFFLITYHANVVVLYICWSQRDNNFHIVKTEIRSHSANLLFGSRLFKKSRLNLMNSSALLLRLLRGSF